MDNELDCQPKVQVIAGPSGIEVAREIASTLQLTEIIPEYKIFPDGESYLRIPTNLEDEILVVQSCHYPQDTNLFQLLNLISTIKRIKDCHLICYIPYMCYARADRAVLEGEAISINTVLTLLETVGVDHLIVLDMHNPGVLDRTKMKTTNLIPSLAMKEYLQMELNSYSNLQVVAPDEGAIDRAKALAKEIDAPYTSLRKTRDPVSGKVYLEMGDADIQRKNIVIVDDIISTGGTLVEASQLLKINGVNQIHYLISHALGTEAVDKLHEIGGGLVASTNSTRSIIGYISTAKDLIRELNI